MDRTRARQLANEYVEQGKPTEWFEVLYAEAETGTSSVPWADLKPNPNLVEWLTQHDSIDKGRALKIGCGYGDDAEELARRGYRTIGFDIAPTAISVCRKRFANSPASFVVADLFDCPEGWHHAFQLVIESYTLQVLPPDIRSRAIEKIAQF